MSPSTRKYSTNVIFVACSRFNLYSMYYIQVIFNDFSLKNKVCVHRHMKYKHIRISGPVDCDICGKTLKSSKNVQEHKRVIHSANKNRFKCLVCGKGYAQPWKLKVSSSHLISCVILCLLFAIFRNMLRSIPILYR